MPKDLLSAKAGRKDADKLDIRVGDAGVYIPDLTEIPVRSADQVCVGAFLCLHRLLVVLLVLKT
jgi:hypothetical protein